MNFLKKCVLLINKAKEFLNLSKNNFHQSFSRFHARPRNMRRNKQALKIAIKKMECENLSSLHSITRSSEFPSNHFFKSATC